MNQIKINSKQMRVLAYVRVLLGLVDQVMALDGRLVSVARLVLGHHVVRLVVVVLMRLLGALLSALHRS